MAIGYILAIIIAGFVAAHKFAKLAESKGYQAGKAKRYPFLLMLFAIAAAVVVYLLSILIGASMPHWQSMMHSVYIVGNVFIISVYILILRQAYRNMMAAPDAKSKRSESDSTNGAAFTPI